MKYLFFILLSSFSLVALAATESTCFGMPDNGNLSNGWQLPSSGKNFEAYSAMGVAAGRNYVHSSVYKAVVDAYQALEIIEPKVRYIYGETGWSIGGKFRPHKSHQNGLSVDFFVPVRDKQGNLSVLPISPLNKFGYNIEFTSQGVYDTYTIDFEAMASHLLAIKKSADKAGISINRVIFDNDLQKLLFSSSKGEELKSAIVFSTKKPWVRHDEHYHIDFSIPCEKAR